MSCVLCLNNSIDYYHQDNNREYWQCLNCQLVFVKSKFHLTPYQEKSVYDLHQNNPEDLGYRTFLNKLVNPLSKKLNKGMKGLDFGSGSGPTISVMLKEQGIGVENYDIFYANKPELLEKFYDFITCTEVIEHVYFPHKVLSNLTKMLKPKGYFGIMTKRVFNKESFKKWHYKNDPTHVCFYSDETFKFIAKNWGYALDFVDTDSIILKKLS